MAKTPPAAPKAATATAGAPEASKGSTLLTAALAKVAKVNANMIRDNIDKRLHAELGPDDKVHYRWVGQVPLSTLTDEEVKAVEEMK